MKLFNLAVLVILYCGTVIAIPESVKLYERLHRNPYIFDVSRSSFRDYKDEWITQKLDHFDETNEATWQMRYYSNDEFYVQGGPFFILVGGEWPIDPSSIKGSHMYDMAKEMNGYLFYTEHRFYGPSQPLGNTTTASLQYLNTDQALADLAHFIRTQKSSIPGATNSGVILVGGSYSASMVTWFRQRYPDLANGAWASSGPIFAKVDLPEYKEMMGWSIRKIGGEKCYNRVEEVFKLIDFDIKNRNYENIQKTFNLCGDVDLDNKLDVWSLYGSLTEKLAGFVQSHKTGKIEKVCEILLNSTVTNPVENFARFFRKKSNECFDASYQSQINYLSDVHQTSDSAGRQWIFQTCNEFGWYQASSSKEQPFGNTVSLAPYFQRCNDLFNGTFPAEVIKQKIQETNKKTGGLKPNVTNVITTQGELDPWRPVGIQEDLNEDAPVVIYKGISHCKDLTSIRPTDNEQIRETKLRVTALVKKWLGISKDN